VRLVGGPHRLGVNEMNKLLLSLAGAAALLTTPAAAADLRAPVVPKAPVIEYVSPWDVAFGANIASDYNFRGISQSDRGPSAGAYVEPRFNITPWLQAYVGIAGTSVKLPTDPALEMNFYGGLRPTFGALSLDFGFIYYYYPRETQLFVDPTGTFLTSTGPGLGIFTLSDTDFWEVYAKGNLAVNDIIGIGAQIFHSPSFLHTGAPGTYLSGSLKLTAPGSLIPDVGAYLSGELGHYWLGTTNALLGNIDLPDYTTWNVGGGFTYKVFTLDLRYYDTNLSRTTCQGLVGDPSGFVSGASKWCDSTFIAKLSFDATLASFK